MLSSKGASYCRAVCVALSFLAILPTTVSGHVVSRQQWQGFPSLVCTCSSKELRNSTIGPLCTTAGGNPNKSVPGWSICYIYDGDLFGGPPTKKARAAFSDENCKAELGQSFKSDCVRWPPGNAGAANRPVLKGDFCKIGLKGTQADCCAALTLSDYLLPADLGGCCAGVTGICNSIPL